MKIRVVFTADLTPEQFKALEEVADVKGYTGATPREAVRKLLESQGMSEVYELPYYCAPVVKGKSC